MDRLDELESKSIYIIREAYANFKNLGMLWSIGKDSTVLLWLVRKAFLGHVPFPVIHIDTGFKIPKMIEYRNKIALELKLNLIVGQNKKALEEKNTFPDGKLTRIECCKLLKTETLKHTLLGDWPRWVLDHTTGKLVKEKNPQPFDAVIVGIRADEEGSRSKERYFSERNKNSEWEIDNQPPEFWDQFKTDFPPGAHIRIHPILDWTELDIWKYIKRENIPVIDLYFSKGGYRYRSLGCEPCTKPIKSDAKDVNEIIKELEEGKLKNIPERAGREQDKEDNGGLETLRREGYM